MSEHNELSPEQKLDMVLDRFDRLIDVIDHQARAIAELAAGVMELSDQVAAMNSDGDPEDDLPTAYLNGSPLK